MDALVTEHVEEDFDLRELLSGVLSQWLLICLLAIMFAGAFGYYAFRMATPKYLSTAVFEMPDAAGTSGLSDVVPLAGLLGGAANATAANVRDMIAGRDFILEVAGDLDLRSDPTFNAWLNPPGGLFAILIQLGISEVPPITDLLVDSTIVSAYRDRVALAETEDGALIVNVTHFDPIVAAEIANTVVRKVLEKDRESKIQEQRSRIGYLSSELAAAQLELDEAVAQVQAFAVGKNIASAEELFQQSQQLVRLRDREQEISERLVGLEALLDFLDTPGADADGLEALLDRFAALRQRDTLLALGEPRAPEAWLALPRELIVNTRAGLQTRQAQVERSLATAEEEAALTAVNAAELAQLEREVKVKTATFEVITQQFKEQSLLSGFELSEGKIFETAVPALAPVSPKKLMLLVAGGLLGGVLGVGFAVVRNMSRGRVHSRRGLQGVLGPAARLFSRDKLPSFRGRKPLNILRAARDIASPEQSALSFALNSEGVPIVTTATAKREASGLAFLVAGQMVGPESKTVVVDLFAQLSCTGETQGGYRVQSLDDTLDLAQPVSPDQVAPRSVARLTFTDDLKELLARYENAVLLLPALRQSSYVLSALASLEPVLVTTARLGRVQQTEMREIGELLPSAGRSGAGIYVLC